MSAMLVSQNSSAGVALFSYENAFFCRNKFAWLLAKWVKILFFFLEQPLTTCSVVYKLGNYKAAVSDQNIDN